MISLAYDVFAPVGATIIWSAVIYKVRDLRKDPRDLALWALCAALAFPALAYTLATPWLSAHLDHAVGIPNVATLLIYGSDVVHTAFAQLLLLAWTHPREQVWVRFRWRLLAVGLALAAMASLFLMAEVPTERPIDFDAAYTTTPYVTEFLLVFYITFGVSMAALGWLCWRYAGMVGRLWLRRGLRLIAVGTGFGLGYCICMLIYIGGRLAGEDPHAWRAAALVIAGTGAPVLCAGLTLPAWGPQLSALHTLNELRPLWRALTRATPEIALDPVALPLRLKLRLYRRVIEIRDGWRALRPYFRPEITATARRRAEAAGLRGDELEATVEAASLKAALRLKVRSAAVTAAAAATDNAGRAHSPAPTGSSLPDEIAFLAQVARAFRSSRVVTAVLTEADTALHKSTGEDHVRAGKAPRRSGRQTLVRRYGNLDRTRRLDPERDYHQIYRSLVLVEFRSQWDALMGLQFAFYRTFAVPAIAQLLDGSGELTHRYLKRGLDTALLMYEMIDHGFDHPRGRQAVRRLNHVHRPHSIDNAQYLYVLGAVLFVPLRWLERYGWRPLCEHERTAAFVFYRELGRRMGIKGIPKSYGEFEEFYDAFDREHVAYSESGRRLMRASREAFTGYFPAVLAPFAGAYIDALLDDRLRRAVGVSRPPLLVRLSLHLILTARALILGWMPLRRQGVGAEAVRPDQKYGFPIADVYPNGYEIGDLGPQPAPRRLSAEPVSSGQGADDRERRTASTSAD